jgi:hypothetical protein
MTMSILPGTPRSLDADGRLYMTTMNGKIICLGSDGRVLSTREASFSKFDRRLGDDLNHDRGELLEITAETAGIVNDTIWEVLRKHPCAAVQRENRINSVD